MNTTELLERIKAKCKELLATAEERTPGKWSSTEHLCFNATQPLGVRLDTGDNRRDFANAAFTASCGGPAEAGWRATIAAIDGLDDVDEARGYQSIAKAIIAAWPEELL